MTQVLSAPSGLATHGQPVRVQLLGGLRARAGCAASSACSASRSAGRAHRPVVDRALVGDGARRDVDDPLAVPDDGQPVAVGDLTDDGGEDVPLAADGEEAVDLGRLDDRAHALLRLAHQDLVGRERRVAQRDGVQVDAHAAGAGAGQLGRRAGEPGAAEVLDAGDEVGLEDLQAASMSSFSVKGSPTWTAGRLAGPCVVEGLADARTETPPMPSPPVRAPKRMTLLPGPAALARWMSSCFITPTHRALTSGLPW